MTRISRSLGRNLRPHHFDSFVCAAGVSEGGDSFFDDGRIHSIEWEENTPAQIVRRFLNDREGLLGELLKNSLSRFNNPQPRIAPSWTRWCCPAGIHTPPLTAGTIEISSPALIGLASPPV